jgi:hypothetical protein
MALLKLFADGSYLKLDSTGLSDRWIWHANRSGTHFVRVSPMALEPGDINGEDDWYRGLGAGEATRYGLDAVITHTAGSASIKMGQSVELTYASNSSGTITTATSDNCSMAGGRVTALRGTGTCMVTFAVEADAMRRAASASVSFELEKGERSSAELGVSLPTRGEIGETLTIGISNSTGLPVTSSVSGPCQLVNATQVRLTSALGTCRVTASVPETDDYLAASVSANIIVSGTPSLRLTASRSGTYVTLAVNLTSTYSRQVTIQRYYSGRWRTVRTTTVGTKTWKITIAQKSKAMFRAVSGGLTSPTVTR